MRKHSNETLEIKAIPALATMSVDDLRSAIRHAKTAERRARRMAHRRSPGLLDGLVAPRLSIYSGIATKSLHVVLELAAVGCLT